MKKIICILCLCLFISGCFKNNKSSAVTAVTTGLSFTAEISTEEAVLLYYVEIEDDGTVNMKSKAKNGDGIDYIFKDGNVTYKYNELSYTTSISLVEESSVMDFIPSVFEKVSKEKNNVEYKSDKYFINGNTEKYNFTLYIGESGLPIKITDNKNGVEAVIKNPTIF